LPSKSDLPLALEPYTLTEEVGEGGAAKVYLCHKDGEARTFAIKLLKRNDRVLANAIDLIHRFERESNLGTKLSHKNLCSPIASGILNGYLYYILYEYLPGGSLLERHEYIRDARSACVVMKFIADAAHFLHQCNVIHRDIKPSNIMFRSFVDRPDEPVLVDFGLAVDLSSKERDTLTGRFYGTPSFASPEQLLDTKNVDHRTDIYSIGVVLFWLLTKKLPYASLAPGAAISAEYISMRQACPPATLRNLGPFPEVIHSICRNCLQIDRDVRYDNAAELSRDLQEAITELEH
jgi:serine/threonine-protein kinase